MAAVSGRKRPVVKSSVNMKYGGSEDVPLELLFLRYAFPCVFITLQRKKITQKEYDSLNDAALNGLVVPRKRLERIFSAAFRRIGVLAKEKGWELWSAQAIKSYFHERHNRLIEDGAESYATAPKVLCELCKVLPGRVVKIGKDGASVRLRNGKKRAVLTCLLPNLALNDEVYVHYGYAVDIL